MDLRTQLQAHLGNAFRLERELGGGGMSRVFVAQDVRLSRQVVIKVLSPELVQGLNAERFEREILLAASLQQANIVGVLSAGEIEGLPYFTMPFVEGESLRSRMGGAGMPIADVLAILRDVTKALAYAHARGIVHRDIKPDNVLLSGGTAMVTDFGIAKALSASRNEAGATLTSVGTSIGTPAYMAPEQVAGDPSLDHRVDLYALGCMAQELITGKSPFADRTPQRMLAAHLSESPTSITSLRADSPAALNTLVGQLLQKDPNDRPQSAHEVLKILESMSTTSNPTLTLSAPGMLPKVLLLYALATGAVAILAKAAVVGIGLPDWVFPGAVGVMLLGLPALLATAYVKRVARHSATATPTITPGGSMVGRPPSGTMATIALRAHPHVSWRRTMRGGVLAMGAFVAVVAGFMTLRAFGIGSAGSLFAKGQLAADDKIVLADFLVAQDDSALAPILAAAVRAAMSQSKSVRLIDPSSISATLTLMQRPHDTPVTPELAREVAERAGAKAVLSGRLAHIGATGYLVSLELTSTAGGASLASFQATAEGAKELLPTIDQLTRELRGKIGESLRQVQRAIPLAQATTSSLEALRKYSEASQANDVDGEYDRAVVLLREAVALDSTFGLAWRKMAVALNNGGGSAAAQDSALQKAFQYANRLPDREKYLAIGAYYNLSRTAHDRGKAIAAYRAAYAADSSSLIASNQLLNIYSFRLQHDSALRYARRNLEIEDRLRGRTFLAMNLIRAGETDAAERMLDSLHRASPESDRDPAVLWSRYLIYLNHGQGDSTAAILAWLRASPQPSDRITAASLVWSREMISGKVTGATATAKEAAAMMAARGAIANFDRLEGQEADIYFRDRHAEAVAALDTIVAGKQWSTALPIDRPYLLVARYYAAAGRPDRARAVMARYLAEDPSAKAPANRAGQTAVEAEIALAERRYPDAIRLFRAAGIAEDGASVECGSCTEFNLARSFDAAGQLDSAMVHYTAYLALPMSNRMDSDPIALARVQKRMGEIYDSRNERQLALTHYGAFAEQWKDADADLQPAVTSVKKRMAELQVKEGR